MLRRHFDVFPLCWTARIKWKTDCAIRMECWSSLVPANVEQESHDYMLSVLFSSCTCLFLLRQRELFQLPRIGTS